MPKQVLHIFILLLANLSLIAHGVVPHHHHEGNICIEHHECTSENSPESSSEKECCPLADEVFFISDNHSHNEHCFICLKDQNNTSLAGCINEIFFTALSLPFIKYNPDPGLTSSYLSLATSSLGLRAPPAS